ncbi:MAG: glycosyltransferase family 2 protein [Desulfovibrionaceae bacterium]|jgi:glycosyltransferase involved in cell wall biosynthesis|nr:glycosyltransferase family 2 protein [Desulfovibrionaceae bacterium]
MTIPRAAPVSISCVMPAYNEARNLVRVVPQVLQVLTGLAEAVELIVVDDGSRDDTVETARALIRAHPQVVLLRLSRNFGKEAALTAGLQAARGDVVTIMDADGQHPAALLPEMLARWREGADVVYAVRRTRADQPALYAGLAGLFYRFVNWGNRIEIPAHAGDFRLMDRKVVQALNRLPERNRFMKGLYAWVGFQSTAIDYEPLPRGHGRTRFGLRGAFTLALTGMVSFSTAPLQLITVLGLLLAMASIGYGAWVVFDYFYEGIAVPGYATIVAGMMFLSGIQLLSVGVLAEYVGRIYDEVKRRPAYLIDQREGGGLPPEDTPQ